MGDSNLPSPPPEKCPLAGAPFWRREGDSPPGRTPGCARESASGGPLRTQACSAFPNCAPWVIRIPLPPPEKCPLAGAPFWRREGDSNPRYWFTQYIRLAGEPVRPLRHLSRRLFMVSPAAAHGKDRMPDGPGRGTRRAPNFQGSGSGIRPDPAPPGRAQSNRPGSLAPPAMIRLPPTHGAVRLAQTIAELFYDTLKFDLPDAFAAKVDGAYRTISHRELQDRVERLALALRGPGPGAAGTGWRSCRENRPEWAMTDFACALLGVVSVPIYHTLTPDQTAYILRDCGARWMLVSNAAQLAKVRPVLDRLPDLETLVVLDCRRGPCRAGSGQAPGDLGPTASGKGRPWRSPPGPGAGLGRRNAGPEDLLTLIYTSGTTGEPKGAMLTPRQPGLQHHRHRGGGHPGPAPPGRPVPQRPAPVPHLRAHRRALRHVPRWASPSTTRRA